MNPAILGLVILSAVCSSKTEDDIRYACRCQDDVIDCSQGDFNEYPPLKDLANSTKTALFDGNIIRTIHVMEPSWSLISLSFTHNLITKIDPGAFQFLPNLTRLDLSHNQLSTEALLPIVFKGPDAMLGMSSIKVLDLSSNILHSLHQDLFEFLTDLEELNLASNPLINLDHGILTALSSIHKTKILNLTSTQLSDIPSNWLNALKNLDVLDLSMNNLQTVPKSLAEARGLRHLILNDNFIVSLTDIPKLPTLQILDVNWMKNLVSVRAHSLVNLPKLKELSISNNVNLWTISEDALIEPGSYEANKTEGAVFPPIEKLDLSNNNLGYLPEILIDRWDSIKVLKLDSNPWVCDCKNQWMVTRLIPLMDDKKIGAPNTLICGAPIEMKGKSMVELSMRHYQMRCLDLYGNQPEKDAKVLIIVLVVILIAIPVSLLFLHLVKKPRGQPGYPSAYYRRTRSFESVNY